MDKCSSDNEGHWDAEEEANLHVPLIHHRVTGEAMVFWILTEQKGFWYSTHFVTDFTHIWCNLGSRQERNIYINWYLTSHTLSCGLLYSASLFLMLTIRPSNAWEYSGLSKFTVHQAHFMQTVKGQDLV